MRLTALAAMFALVLWGAPALGQGCVSPDSDGDTVNDCEDNCINVPNASQDDSDGDSCGNVCDADFDQNSAVTFRDMKRLQENVGTTNSNFDLTEPIGDVVTMEDFHVFQAAYLSAPGPSGPRARRQERWHAPNGNRFLEFNRKNHVEYRVERRSQHAQI